MIEDFDYQQRKEKRLRMACLSTSFLDIALFGIVYPLIGYTITKIFFIDVDCTINFDWKRQTTLLRATTGLGLILAILRSGLFAAAYYFAKRNQMRMHSNHDRERYSSLFIPFNHDSISDTTQQRISKTYQYTNILILMLNFFCLLSVLSHFGAWPDIPIIPEECNPLDSTLCALPFPSFHHMMEDNTTNTGWRVNLKGLPPLRGGIPLHPKFLNDLDGFSTMAPILFYLDGLKEAHESAIDAPSKLQGPQYIAKSVTSESITLLISVDDKTLVPHSAEIDYLDPNRPLVMVIPAQPLRHNTHFALAVVNAIDINGNRLPQSPGLQSAFEETSTLTNHRFTDIILPALGQAAPWVGATKNLESVVQMLFDFVTISEECQIGHTRKVRDGTLAHVERWNWEDHVELVSEKKHDCSTSDSLIARTYHINLDVPTFLKERSRYSTLDHSAVDSGKPVSIGKTKAMIRIPCSVQRAASGDQSGKPVKVIMEFGHGLFYHRGEVTDRFLSRMADDNGYILMAMDWRGMSRSDLPVIIKTLIGNPNLFQSVRDNLIQGYSDKFALQHFSRNGMLNWLKIDGASIPTKNNVQPTSMFYGISQGGILGGGYLALSASTALIDRGVLGSPGTPFTAVLTRSLDFVKYDTVMLFNFYNNRHVRLLLSLLQMGWDSVESSGLLAPPVYDSLPPILLQTGLGDPIVPTSACEGMARAMNASTLPNNPRSVFRVPVAQAANQPNAILTELMYEKEYNSLPLDNTLPEKNSVHFCVRWDHAMIDQIVEFANTGKIIDPCVDDQCRRQFAHC
eukprot:CAMPEP_0181089100 /NCGR_PEP_ID=MMETSP1071-20121207/7127_1 /TAXON_ID=35127 /ORGANISM="Thalassiosira sp., Strain NH16" /LENGTH=796 /DNA_ID=CAMNT_0023171035 /DNA_START=286 /DNA_END=2676 /DNA_ORIENTATION=-